MICVYPADCGDFSNNGLGPVAPQSCTVTETLNGEWELKLVHPIDDLGKWQRLTEGCIIRAPVPAAPTPRVQVSIPEHNDLQDVYVVDTDRPEASVKGGTLRLRTGPGTGYKVLQQYKNGTIVQVISTANAAWYEVIMPDGKHGYMDTRFLRYDHTAGSYSEAVNTVVEPRQLREQPFRIYRVVPELDRITVHARHIFYDLLDNMIQKIEPSASMAGASVVQNISSECMSEHSFSFYSDLTSTAEGVILENVNPVEALLGEGGIVRKYGAELARDWHEVFLVKRVGRDSDVHIRERKNLTGISFDVDTTNVVTRIMPTGEDADGNILYLPELYVDSPNIGAYTQPKWVHMAVSEAKEVAEGENYKSLTACYEEMRSAAQAEYDAGCDLPTVTLKVSFVNLTDAEEYKQFKALSDIFLGDAVRVVARRIGIEVSMRMTQYTYDCLTKKYTSVTLGTAAPTLEGTMVSAHQLAAGSITGMKLALNSIGTGHLQNGSVGSLQVRNAAIRTAHIQDAAITSAHIQEAAINRAHIAEALIQTLNANAITAVSAKIQELAAGSITTDELYTSIAMIATAQLTTANIINADIQWADIEALSADIARISKAQITSANIDEANIDWAAITTLSSAVASMVKADIETADIDWSHIKDLATDTAIITQGTAGELYISKLAVTEANLVSLTVGELVVKGEDGRFYSVSVGSDGKVKTALKQVSNDDVVDASIHGGEKIIEGSITAATLNVNDIFANNAVISNLIAANLDVDELFAREATITALNAMDITGNEYLKLMVTKKADQTSVDELGERVEAAELKLTEDAIISTVRGSKQYQEDLASARSAGGGPEFVVGTQTTSTAAWTGNASFTELKDGQQIVYWLPYGSGSNVTLNLTLGNGQTTGAIACYYSQSTRLGTQYTAGNILHLTYRENAQFYTSTIAQGWWADANYNSDTYDRIRVAANIKAKTAIGPSRIVVGDASGYFNLAAGVTFDLTRPILWSTASVNAGSSTNNCYMAYSSCYLRNTVPDFNGIAYRMVYIVGTLSNNFFTPADDFLLWQEPEGEDEYTYIALGLLTSAYNMILYPEHPLYRFVDGDFMPLSQVAYEAYVEAGNVREEMSTAIEQTNAAIAMKADKTVTDALSTRVSYAELKLQPDQLASSVKSSSVYIADQAKERNYIQSSYPEVVFQNLYLMNGSAVTTSKTRGYSLSSQFFTMSNGGKNLRLSFDIKRTGVATTDSEGRYFGFGIRYYYYNENNVWSNAIYPIYLRTSDSYFKDTDTYWTRMWIRDIDMSALGPRSISSFNIGVEELEGATGTINIKNVMLEVGTALNNWTPAVEDGYYMNNRLTNAESTISQHSSQISLKVNTSTYNTEKVYRSSAVPTTKYANMLWLDLSVTPPVLRRWTGSTWVAVAAEEVKTSGIYIGANNVKITTEEFLLQLLDPSNNENILMEMSANGRVGFTELHAQQIVSPSVAGSYCGPNMLYVQPSYIGSSDTYFRSLAEACNAVNNKYLSYDVTIRLPASAVLYESTTIALQGISGPGKLFIGTYYDSCTVYGYMTITACSAYIQFMCFTLKEGRLVDDPTNDTNPFQVECKFCHYVEFNNVTLDAAGIDYATFSVKASTLFLMAVGIYNTSLGISGYQASCYLSSCFGSCSSWLFYFIGGLVFANGTIPGGSTATVSAAQYFSSGTSIDYGTATPAVLPDQTSVIKASLTRTYQGGWRSDTLDAVQGVYSDYGYSTSLSWNYGCIWFNTLKTLLSGKTIRSATLTLHRKPGNGSFSARTVYLYAITNTLASGSATIKANFGALGTIGRDQQVTFSIPTSVITGLVSGSYGGICLWEPPYNFGGSSYSENYLRISGTDAADAYIPYLTVVHSG